MEVKEYIEREKALDAITEWLMKALRSENMSSYNEGERAAYRTALSEIAGIPAADVRPVEWIPVTERLPEDECPVFVTYIGFHDHKPMANMLAYIDRDLGWCWWDDDIPGGVPCSVEITHWQQLPEPPKEDKA